MSATVISIDRLSKQYRIRERKSYQTLRDAITHLFRKPFRFRQPETRAAQEEYIWALREISLEVKKGEVLGVIGSNGAGKTTLLKVLSRITTPTLGSAKVHGRVGSLLEVGVGFHPELTGRQNIYLNGQLHRN